MAEGLKIGRVGEQVLAASMDAMAVVDAGRHVTANQQYADLYGFSRPEELAGESWARRIGPDERTRFEREILPSCRADGR